MKKEVAFGITSNNPPLMAYRLAKKGSGQRKGWIINYQCVSIELIHSEVGNN